MSPPALRRAASADIAWICDQEARDEIARFICVWSRQEHLANLEDSDKAYLIAEDAEGRRAGYAILAGLARGEGAIELVRIVAAKPGGGAGQSILAAIQRQVFGEIGAERLWLDVAEFNARARHVYRKAGFSVERTVPEGAVIAGQPVTLLVMVMDRAASADVRPG